MKIEINKKTLYLCEYTITRKDQSVETFTLDIKTYFIHDVCHYVVEHHLKFSDGFWGMLSQGYSFRDLFGKQNPITSELRLIEQIVGPIQSVYLGYMPKEHFEEAIKHIDFTVTQEVLEACINEITAIMKQWNELAIGQQLTLEW